MKPGCLAFCELSRDAYLESIRENYPAGMIGHSQGMGHSEPAKNYSTGGFHIGMLSLLFNTLIIFVLNSSFDKKFYK